LYSLTNTQNGDLLEGDPPAWASWESDAHYLPDIFYKKKSSASLSVLIRWTASDPITADDDALASYQQVELVILAIGLALRGLWITQFPENYADVPSYIINSPYPFSEYEQLSHTIQDLITGYADTYVTFLIHVFRLSSDCLHRLQKLDAAYAKTKPSKPVAKSKAKSKDTATEGVGDTGKDVPDNAGGSESVAAVDTTKRPAAQGNRRYVPMTHYNHISNY
jgi:hypothetical protein